MGTLANIALLALMVVPVAHPFVPIEFFPSEALWWIHVVPVAVLAYEHGPVGAVVGLIWSGFLSFGAEQVHGPGVGGPVHLDALRKVTGPLIFTDLLVIGLGLYGRHAAEQLRHRAHHDALTGLPNRTVLLDRIEQRIYRADREVGTNFAILFIDMDDFKLLNDSLGHGAGNQTLVRFASRVRRCVRDADTVARWGGDEFVVLLDEIRTGEDAVEVAKRIHTSLDAPVEVRGERVQLHSSIGIALGGPPPLEADALVSRADTAMYRAKRRGKNQIEVYDSAQRQDSRTRLGMEMDIRSGLERGEFYFEYQPVVRAEDEALAGFEALLRWRHPEEGPMAPGRFIQVAEETGLIVPLGDFACVEACKTLARWERHFPEREGVFLSLNLSPLQLARSEFADRLTSLCEQNGVPPGRLKLEITETSLLEGDEPTRRTLHSLREQGFQLALDDFGTGYSSLSYLHRYPLSYLKIDRTFVHGLGTNRSNLKILQAVQALSTQLGYETVAEGVETAREAARIRQLGCDYIQGFHIARPLSASRAEDMLAGEGEGESRPRLAVVG